METSDLYALLLFAREQYKFWEKQCNANNFNHEQDKKDASTSMNYYDNIVRTIEGELFDRLRSIFGEDPAYAD